MAAPTVTHVSPNYSALAGGITVTITGTNFNVSPPVVKFGGVVASGVVVGGPTSLTAIVPAQPTAIPAQVTVTTTDGTSPVNNNAIFYYFDNLAAAEFSVVNPWFDGGANYVVAGQWVFLNITRLNNLAPYGGAGPTKFSLVWDSATGAIQQGPLSL